MYLIDAKTNILKFDPFLLANLIALLLLKHNQYQTLAHSLSLGTYQIICKISEASMGHTTTTYIQTLRQTCLLRQHFSF